MSLALLLLGSCQKQEELAADAATAQGMASFGVRSVLNDASPDDRISGLRVMAFARGSGAVRSNVYYPAADLAQQLTHHMAAGDYDFVFLANEPASMHAKFDNILNLGALAAADIPSEAINDAADIPMVLRVDNVTVLAGTAGVSIGGQVHKPWDIRPVRLAVRMDILLWSANGAASDFNGAVFSNLPDGVPVLGAYTGAHTTTRAYAADAFTPASADGAVWAFQLKRIILPANLFTPAGEQARVAQFNVLLAGGQPGCTFAVDETGGDYTLPGNKYLQVTAQVKYPMVVNIEASPWDDIPVDGTMYGQRTLKLSQLQATVSELGMARIYFDSNQPGVFVEATGYTGTSGTNTFNVNDVFPGLTGSSPANVHYTTATSSGYLDICLLKSYDIPQSDYRIYINANGLRRELTLHAVERQPAALHHFCGTFHRWNQTGERLIYLKAFGGAWTAAVEYPEGQSPFAVLSTSKSLDPAVGTDAPGDAENYLVTDGSQTVSGSGALYLRVGLTGKLASASSAPRYARIRLTGDGGTRFFYVRQGEAADYVMRPQDPGKDGETWGTPSPRPKAARFSPYNLTDPGKNPGRVDRGTRGYAFTQYPSQAGYNFLWNGTAAYPPQTAVTPAPVAEPFRFWTAAPQWETCPQGYHRPDDGSTSAYVDLTPSAKVIVNSTLRQSLWLNPPQNTGMHSGNTNTDNIVYGYYADGFFDRHRIHSWSGSFYTVNQAGSGADLAFMGSLAYNPLSFASLFLPMANGLNADGSVNYQPMSWYWSSSVSSQTKGLSLSVYFGQLSMMEVHYLSDGYSPIGQSIRCVADE